MIPRRCLSGLVAAALVLPIVICVVLAVARLLAAMNDPNGALVLDRLGLAGGLLWIVTLIGLVLVLALRSLESPGDDLPEE